MQRRDDHALWRFSARVDGENMQSPVGRKLREKMEISSSFAVLLSHKSTCQIWAPCMRLMTPVVQSPGPSRTAPSNLI